MEQTSKNYTKEIATVLSVLVLLALAYYIYSARVVLWPSNNQVANPASANCQLSGGVSEIVTDNQGGQFGVCRLSDGQICEEWTWLREKRCLSPEEYLAQVAKGEDIFSAYFSCADDKTIAAHFSSQQAKLILSDGRTLDLTVATSASGARYASADEQTVFWNKGDQANLEEQGKVTYSNCLAGK